MKSKLKPVHEVRREHRERAPESMTHFDSMRKNLTEAIARRIHKHIKPDPMALDEDDIILEREGWLTKEEMKAAVAILYEEHNYGDEIDLEDCISEAQKRNVL